MNEDEFDIPLPPGESETPATKENREQKKPSVIQAPEPKEFPSESSKAVKVETPQKEKDTSNRKTERRSNLRASTENKEHSRKTSPHERRTPPVKNEKLMFTFIVQGLDQREKIFPSSIIKHTKALPSLTFCGNPRYESGAYKSRKEVLTSCETALKELMEKIMGGCAVTTDMPHQASVKGVMSEGHHCRPWYLEKVNASPKTSNKDKGNTAEKRNIDISVRDADSKQGLHKEYNEFIKLLDPADELQSSDQLAGNSGSNIQRYSPNWSSDSRSPSPEPKTSQSAVPVSSIQPVAVVPKIGLKLIPKTRVKIDLQVFDDDEKTEESSTSEEKRMTFGHDLKLSNKNKADQQTKQQKAEDDKSKEEMKPNVKESKENEGRNKESSKSDSKNKESMKREEAKKDERRKEDARKEGKRKDGKEVTRKEERKREESKVERKDDTRKDERKREESEGTHKEDSRKDGRKREESEETRKEDSRKDERKREESEGTRKEDSRKDERKREEREGTRKEDPRKDERKREESEGARKEDLRKDERKREEREGTRKEDSRKDERKREESEGTRKEDSRKDEQKREESGGTRKADTRKDERRREESKGTLKEDSRKDERKREESEAKRKENESKDEKKREEKDSRKERDQKERERDREHQHEMRLSERDRGRSDRTRSRSPSRSEKQGKQTKPDSRNLKRRKSPEIQRNERKRRRSGSHQKETTNGKFDKTQTEEKLRVSMPCTAPPPPEDVATAVSEKPPPSPVGSTEQVNESTGKQSPKDDSEELSKRISLDERLERELGIKALVSEPEPSDPEPLTTPVLSRSQEPLSLECYQFAFMSESEMENFSPVQRRGFGPKAASMGSLVFSCPTVFPFRPYIPPHIEALLFNRPVSVVPQPAAEPIPVELSEEKTEELNGEQPDNAKDPEDWDGKLKLLEEAASNLESGDETVLEDIEEKLLLFEAMSIVPGKERSPPPVVRTKQKRSKPKPIVLKPAEKGILVMPVFNLDENAKKSKQKSVMFADNIKPGDGSSSSGGEELHSPPPPTETAPENLKKRKRKKKKVANNDDDGSDSEFDKLPPPPPPPGSPPPHLLRYRLPVDTPVDTPADTEEPIPADSPPPPPPGEE